MCFVNNTQSLVWMEGLKHRNVSVFKKERINVDAGPMGVTKCTSSVAAQDGLATDYQGRAIKKVCNIERYMERPLESLTPQRN